MKKRGAPVKYFGIDKEIRRLYKSKKSLSLIDYDIFKNWYLSQNGCEYCGLNSTDSLKLFYKYPSSTRGGRRGKSLELDRKNPEMDYGENISNLALSCYWCNNAKTNYFTFEEFQKIGESIGLIQKNRLQNC